MTAAPPSFSPTEERRALRFVFATLFLNAMAFGIIIPVVPQLVMQLAKVGIGEATAIGGLLAVTFAAFQFIFSPIVGNLSDRFGRRPVLLGSIFGFAVDFMILAFAPTLGWLFIARALTGVFGASNGPAQSVIADITAPEHRSQRFGKLSAAFGMGFVLGPAIGGGLAYIGGNSLPLYSAAALALANFIYGLLALPETLPHDRRRAFSWAKANPVGAFGLVRRQPGIGGISAVYFFWQLASLIYPMIWAYYAADRYGWSPGAVGLSLAMVGVSMVIMQMLFAKRIIAHFGDRRTAMIGLFGGAATMLGLAFASSGWAAAPLFIPMALGSLVHPCLTALMTKNATENNQGEVQGFASGVLAIGSIVAPLVYNPLHAQFSGANPPFAFDGIAFAVAAASGFLALAILTRLRD